MTAIAEAAAFLSQTWPVFPTAGKVPLVKWRERASQDVAAVRAMFAADATGIGVPMGAGSGCFLVDLDGADGLEWLAATRHRLPETRQHRTPSGGVHLLFRWPAGRTIRNSVRKIAPGVDIRGEGGFAVFPPSPGYVIEDDAMPADAPAWLLDLIDPPAPPPAPREPYRSARHEIPHRYVEAALRDECEAVARAAEGTRNDTLNRAAFALGQLVAAGALDDATARAELTHAARSAGLDPRETALTIDSGLKAGKQQPRQIPERATGASIQPRPIATRVAPSAPVSGSGRDFLRLLPSPDAAPDNPTALTDGGKPNVLPLVYWNHIAPALGADDFIEGLLIRSAMSVIYGPSNCGKTFWTTDLALHVATGRTWNGRQLEPCGVIYCALEGSHGIQNRVAAWRKHYGLEGVEVPFAIIPVSLNLLDPEADTERVIDAIHAASAEMGIKVGWVVMDTLSRAMAGGNENSPEDMGALVTNGTRIQQATGAHVTWIHHSGKDQAQGARGHSLLRAATDTEIEISRPDKDSPSTAKVTKQREMEIEGEWTFTLQTVELGTNKRGKPVTSCIVTPADKGSVTPILRLAPGAKAGLAALHEATIDHGKPATSRDMPPGVKVVTLEAWRREFYARSHLESTDAKRQAFHRAIKDLRQEGVVGVMHDQAWIIERNKP